MKRTVLAVLPVTALMLITACASGVRQSETNTATTKGLPRGGSRSAEMAAANACAAMKEIMDTWNDHFDERIFQPIDISNLRRQLSNLRAADRQAKWTALASKLNALANDVNAVPNPTAQVAAEANNATQLCSRLLPGPTSTAIRSLSAMEFIHAASLDQT